MVFGSRSGAQGGGGDDSEQNSKGSEELKRKWSDLEDSMKAMKLALSKENAEKSAKIRRLMEENILLEEQTQMREKNTARRPGPMARPNPLVLFSEEVWEMIIAKMDYSSDLESLCLAYPNLKPLVMKTKRTIFMFENVIPIVSKCLDLKDIINCRLACGKWNQDVSALLANWTSPSLLPDSLTNDEVTSKTPIPDRKPPQTLKAAYHFDNYRKIQKFLVKTADHQGNPLLGRILRVSVDGETEFKKFWKSILELVVKFGEHVWNFEFNCLLGYFDQVAFYKALQEVLVYLPNLKYLAVDCYFNGYASNLTKLVAQIGSYPLPPLPYLQGLKLVLNSEITMITAFAPYFTQQIRRLETFANVNLKDEWLRGFINLEHLEVQLNSKHDILRLLKFPSRNLKKLCLEPKCYVGEPLVSFTSEQIGSSFEKFSRLEYLDLGYFEVARGSSLGSMRFSSLKILKIAANVEEDDLQRNLDFILWFPSLKHLIIRTTYRYDTTPLNVDEMDKHSTLKIRKYLYTNTILNSNIWALIPSLELLKLETGARKEKYTREMFENRVG